MITISEIVAKTETMFDLFNAHFYNAEMIRPAITVSPDSGRGAYGWCSVYEIWQGNGVAHREINITAEYINRPISEVAATMLHEMAHLYNLTHGIKDVSSMNCAPLRKPRMKFSATEMLASLPQASAHPSKSAWGSDGSFFPSASYSFATSACARAY